ncbi:MAG: hypothetical protein K8R87_12290 [Verrucomicrobia bacterium]|nr:hypothetical protein [Verrucomicrobiota bacterium]
MLTGGEEICQALPAKFLVDQRVFPQVIQDYTAGINFEIGSQRVSRKCQAQSYACPHDDGLQNGKPPGRGEAVKKQL